MVEFNPRYNFLIPYCLYIFTAVLIDPSPFYFVRATLNLEWSRGVYVMKKVPLQEHSGNRI